jgi:hypothetical protein
MAITRAQQVRQMLRKGSEPMEQAGVMNYMPSEMITVPRIAKSSPNTPTAKLAYITPEEQDILVKLNLYGSLEGKPNRGPGGVPSLEGDFGSPTGQVDTSPGSGGTYSGGGAEYGGAGADYSGFVDTGSGDYVKIDRNIPVSDQTPTSFVDKVTDRIKGFGTGVKNYLSDPSNRKGLAANAALISLFGPLGLLFSGLARTSKFQDMLSNLKGDDLLKGTSTIEFDDPINKDVLKFIDKDKQITDSRFPNIEPTYANFNLDLFPGAKVIPVKNYTKEDLEKLGAKKGFLGPNEQLEELQKYYDAVQQLSGPKSKFATDNPTKAREFIKDQSKIPFGGGSYNIDMDLIPKDFLETQKDLKEQISPIKLFMDT